MRGYTDVHQHVCNSAVMTEIDVIVMRSSSQHILYPPRLDLYCVNHNPSHSPPHIVSTITHPYHSHFFFFNDTATTEIYTLSLHDALPFFFKEHAPHLHSPFSLPCRLPL